MAATNAEQIYLSAVPAQDAPSSSLSSANFISNSPVVLKRSCSTLNVALILVNVILGILCCVFIALYVIEKAENYDDGPSNSKQSGDWTRLGNSSTAKTCVGAKNNQYQEVPYNGSSGFIVAIKLVHKGGQVGCEDKNQWKAANWGCVHHGDTRYINMIITDSENRIIYPSPRLVMRGPGGWYVLPGYTVKSPELVLSDFGNPYYLKNGEKLKIWYGGDLFGYHELDNHGFTCMEFYVYFLGV